MENERRQGDPSENVIRLVSESTKHNEVIMDKGFEYVEKRLAGLFDSLNHRLDVEVKRIDGLRSDDQRNIAVANDNAIKTAEKLQQEVTRNAEILRDSVAKTAEAFARQFALITDEVYKRIAQLERAQYEQSGKNLSAPDLSKIVSDLVEKQNVEKGKQSMSTPLLIGLGIAGGALLMRILEKFF